MDSESHARVWEMINTIPFGGLCLIESDDSVRRIVTALAAVGIDSRPERNGVSYPGDGLSIVDDLLSELIIGLVKRRFDGVARESDESDLRDHRGFEFHETEIFELLNLANISFIGGLRESAILAQATGLLTTLEVGRPQALIHMSGGEVVMTSAGHTSRDWTLILIVTEAINRRYSVGRVAGRCTL